MCGKKQTQVHPRTKDYGTSSSDCRAVSGRVVKIKTREGDRKTENGSVSLHLIIVFSFFQFFKLYIYGLYTLLLLLLARVSGRLVDAAPHNE